MLEFGEFVLTWLGSGGVLMLAMVCIGMVVLGEEHNRKD